VVHDFLSDAGLSFKNIRHHILHPGGAKVMATYRSAFGLSDDALTIARECMRQFGNLSSAAVLVMLSNLVASGVPQAGDTGLMLALGPGFAAEMLAIVW
jgi:alkylresorcinol/alkylpyrone synthase